MPTTLLKEVEKGKGTAVPMEARWTKMEGDKTGYLTRGQEYSRFTLPAILPETSDKKGGSGTNQHGFQGLGAQVVNHLANKLTNIMFPISKSFFRLAFEEDTKEALEARNIDVLELSELFVTVEKKVEDLQNRIAARVAYTEAFKNLLITGNVLMYTPRKGALQAIKMDRYNHSFDMSGNLLELMILQEKAFIMLSQDIQDIIKNSDKMKTPEDDAPVKLYTWIYRISETEYGVSQTVEDLVIKDFQTVKVDDLPYIPVRWNVTYGEDYGRGRVEDHSGDFYMIELLSEAMAKGAILMSDVKYLVKPGSVTDIDDLSGSPTGEFVFGNIDDIGVLQLDRFAESDRVVAVLDKYERRVGQAFLLGSANRREGERVTATEIRLDAVDAETSLGGNYTSLAASWLVPQARLYLKMVNFPFPDQVVPDIVTGLEVFGKLGDLDKIEQYTQMLQLPQAWPPQLQRITKWEEYSKLVAANLSMKLPFIMDKEEQKVLKRQEDAARQQEVLANSTENAASEIVKQGGPAVIGGGQ